MRDEQYTYEDYVSDFELDHRGFDGVPNEPALSPCPEKRTENKPESKDSSSSEDLRTLKYRADETMVPFRRKTQS